MIGSTSVWENKSVPEKYPSLFYNEKEYVPEARSDRSAIAQRIGTVTLQSSDGAPEHAVQVDLFSISDADPETVLLVLFPDGNCYRYYASSEDAGDLD